MTSRSVAASRDDTPVVSAVRLWALCWQAWSPALANPRYGLTEGRAGSRIRADLDYEWRTGKLPRAQRAPRRGRSSRRVVLGRSS